MNTKQFNCSTLLTLVRKLNWMVLFYMCILSANGQTDSCKYWHDMWTYATYTTPGSFDSVELYSDSNIKYIMNHNKLLVNNKVILKIKNAYWYCNLYLLQKNDTFIFYVYVVYNNKWKLNSHHLKWPNGILLLIKDQKVIKKMEGLYMLWSDETCNRLSEILEKKYDGFHED